MVSLKQTKNLKRIIDAYPLEGMDGGGKIKKQKLIQTKTKLYIETFCNMSQGWKS